MRRFNVLPPVQPWPEPPLLTRFSLQSEPSLYSNIAIENATSIRHIKNQFSDSQLTMQLDNWPTSSGTNTSVPGFLQTDANNWQSKSSTSYSGSSGHASSQFVQHMSRKNEQPACLKCQRQERKGKKNRMLCPNPCYDCQKNTCTGRSRNLPNVPCGGMWS